jgi:Divergent InlB B-repeat domain
MQLCARLGAVACIIGAFACGGSTSSSNPGSGGPPASSPTAMLNVTLDGSGSVSSNPAGIDCGATCSMSFTQGTSVVLTAMAASGQAFSGWSGACSGTDSCTVMLNADTAVTAQFAATPVTVPLPPTTPPPTTPPVDDCAGLLPAALPAPVVAVLPQSGCTDAASDDGIGNYLLGFTNGDGPTDFPEYLFFTIQSGKAVQIGDMVLGGDETQSFIYGQPSGFTLFERFGHDGNGGLSTYSHDGTTQSRQQVVPPNLSLQPVSSSSVDPSGGTAIAFQQEDASTSQVTTYYRRFDKTGTPETNSLPIDPLGRAPNAIGVALSGHALVMVSTDNSGWQARWLAKDGTFLTDWFTIPSPQPDTPLVPVIGWLLDGNLVIGFNGGSQGVALANLNYKYEILDGKTSVNAPPAWLQAREADPFFAIRGGRGYAAFNPAGTCVEALTAAGKSCGCLNVPSISGHTRVGRDGSLMVAEPQVNFGTCTWDLYPQLFK